MSVKAGFSFEGPPQTAASDDPQGASDRVVLTGNWTALNLGRTSEQLKTQVSARQKQGQSLGWDLSQLGSVDTSGAFLLLQISKGELRLDQLQHRPEVLKIFELVKSADRPAVPPQKPLGLIFGGLVKLGRAVLDIGSELYGSMVFLGQLVAAIFRSLIDPRRVRLTAWFALAERAGLDAIPIVGFANFFIGAVLAFLAADLLLQFGAQVFAVDLIAASMLREFAVVITSVLIAGRSASAFAAELGSMKMNQEIDAMKILGVDPFEALVLPRLVALFFMLPLLTFLGTMSGLVGGFLVTYVKLGMNPAFFFQRMLDNISITHFWVGLSKAPVFALCIAAIGCRQGLMVEGDVESLGRKVTAAVVQAIFCIIALDAVFALIYLELGL